MWTSCLCRGRPLYLFACAVYLGFFYGVLVGLLGRNENGSPFSFSGLFFPSSSFDFKGQRGFMGGNPTLEEDVAYTERTPCWEWSYRHNSVSCKSSRARAGERLGRSHRTACDNTRGSELEPITLSAPSERRGVNSSATEGCAHFGPPVVMRRCSDAYPSEPWPHSHCCVSDALWRDHRGEGVAGGIVLLY